MTDANKTTYRNLYNTVFKYVYPDEAWFRAMIEDRYQFVLLSKDSIQLVHQLIDQTENPGVSEVAHIEATLFVLRDGFFVDNMYGNMIKSGFTSIHKRMGPNNEHYDSSNAFKTAVTVNNKHPYVRLTIHVIDITGPTKDPIRFTYDDFNKMMHEYEYDDSMTAYRVGLDRCEIKNINPNRFKENSPFKRPSNILFTFTIEDQIVRPNEQAYYSA